MNVLWMLASAAFAQAPPPAEHALVPTAPQPPAPSTLLNPIPGVPPAIPHPGVSPPAPAEDIFPPIETRHLSAEERRSLELACGNPLAQGSALHRQCVIGQLNALRAAGPQPDPKLLSPSERSFVEQACAETRRQGPALYNRCRAAQARSLRR